MDAWSWWKWNIKIESWHMLFTLQKKLTCNARQSIHDASSIGNSHSEMCYGADFHTSMRTKMSVHHRHNTHRYEGVKAFEFTSSAYSINMYQLLRRSRVHNILSKNYGVTVLPCENRTTETYFFLRLNER